MPSPPATRVAVVLDTAPPWSKGGRERRYTELLKQFEAASLDVTVYTMRWWDRRPTGRVSYVAITPLLPLYRNGRRSILPGVVFALGTLRLLLRRYDVILADHMPYLQLFPLRLVAWVRRVPLVAEWHESWSAEYWREYLGPLGRLGSAIERASERLPDLIVPVAPSLVRELRGHGVADRRLVLMSNGVDRETASSVRPDDAAPEVLFVGRLLAHKRPDLALEGFARLAPRPEPPRMGLVGVGPERERLSALAERLGVASRVTFYGTVDDDLETWALLRGARVLVSTSEREGFGLTVAESLALGTPVVTVDCEGNEARHLVSDGLTGSLVACGDADAVARAVDGWLDRSASHDEVRAAFWGAHPDLDWSVTAAGYAQLLVDLARGR